MKCTLDKHQTRSGANIVVACVASVFGAKNEERESNTARKMGQVKERGGGRKKEGKFLLSPPPLSFFGSRSIFRAVKNENPVSRLSSIVLCSENARKRLLRWLIMLLSSQRENFNFPHG